MKKVGIGFVALLLSTTVQADWLMDFETVTTQKGKITKSLARHYVTSNQLRLDTYALKDQKWVLEMYTIHEPNEITFYFPNEKAFIRMGGDSGAQLSTPQKPADWYKPTGVERTIAKIACNQFSGSGPDREGVVRKEEVCMAPSLQGVADIMQKLHCGVGAEMGGKGIPVEVIQETPGTDSVSHMKLLRLSTEPIPSETFAPPADYVKKDQEWFFTKMMGMVAGGQVEMEAVGGAKVDPVSKTTKGVQKGIEKATKE